MRTGLLTLPMMLFCALSCSVQDRSVEAPVYVEFGVSSEDALVRSSVSDDRTASLQILVFDAASGKLESGGRTESGRISLMVPSGRELSCRAVVNLPELRLPDGMVEDDFLSETARLEDCSGTLLPMCAHGQAVFKSSGNMSLVARRMVSKIVLDTLECAFVGKMEGVKEVTAVRMFLENVCASEPFSMIPTDSGLWLNRMKLDECLPDNLREYLVCELGLHVESSEAQTLYKALYCLPNPVANDISSETDPYWSPRPTRLVLELNLDGRTQYYPLTFSEPMRSNCVYRISRLRITGPGSDNPDVPVAGKNVSFTVSVSPWEDGETQDVTI